MTNDPGSDNRRLRALFNTQGLLDALQHPDPALRKRAAAALRALGSQDAVPALQTALQQEDDEQARAAIVAALDALNAASGADPDPVENAAAETVEAEDDDSLLSTEDAMVNRLIAQLQSDQPQVIIDAARQLGDMNNKLAVEPLVMLFSNTRSSIEVRLAVAEALLKLESAPVEVALLANLRNGDWHIRRNGAAILGTLRATWAIEPLATALRDPHPVVRRTARAALRHIGTPEARAALARYGTGGLAQRRPSTDDSADATIPVAPTKGLLQRVNEGSAGDADETKDGDDTRPRPPDHKANKPLQRDIPDDDKPSSPEA